MTTKKIGCSLIYWISYNGFGFAPDRYTTSNWYTNLKSNQNMDDPKGVNYLLYEKFI